MIRHLVVKSTLRPNFPQLLSFFKHHVFAIVNDVSRSKILLPTFHEIHMAEKASERDRFTWVLFYTFAGALLAGLSLILYDFDLGAILYLFIIPIVSLCLLAIGARKKSRRSLLVLPVLAVYWSASWLLLKNSVDLHEGIQWLLHSKTYKAEVFAQPSPPSGELRHLEWDGWGFPGAGDTVVYLVFDPNDALINAAHNHSTGKFDGIPCEVWRVRRLNNHWYSVTFYTDTDWNHCS
jgi:hypothetical protein